MTIAETRSEGIAQLTIEGKIDTNTSPQLQKAILQAFQKSNTVVLDMSKVEYISSSGLRALLIGQKTANSKGGKMKLVHITSSVMQVFKMTGFASMLTIE